jgi:hypothetical protein
MRALYYRLIDWWRGYTDEDVWNAANKMMCPSGPGDVVPLTHGEYKAVIAGRVLSYDGSYWHLKPQ